MRLRPLIAVLLALAPAAGGCGSGGGGASGPPPNPSILAVTPAAAWRNDTLTLAITGTDTAWSAASPPDVFAGTDVAVESVAVESPTALSVRVRLSYDATLGLRLLFVGTGSSFLATPVFEVKAPIAAAWFSQPFVRSSVLVGSCIANRPGDAVDAPVVAVASNGDPLPMFLDDPHGFIVVLPEDAPLGPFDLLVHRTGADGSSTLRVPAGSIAPRATVLTSFPASVSLPTADGTALHRYTTTTTGLVEFPMTSSDPGLPIHFVYAHESPFAPPIVGLAPILYGTDAPGPRAVALAGETFDVIVFAGHTSYGIGVAESPAPLVAEAEPNDKSSTAQPLALPALVHPATIDAATGADWFTFDAAAGDIGKRVRVVASPGPALSVSVYRADGAVLGGGSGGGAGSAVDVLSSAITAAGKIYVLVSSAATPSTPDVTSAYRLYLRLEAP